MDGFSKTISRQRLQEMKHESESSSGLARQRKVELPRQDTHISQSVSQMQQTEALKPSHSRLQEMRKQVDQVMIDIDKLVRFTARCSSDDDLELKNEIDNDVAKATVVRLLSLNRATTSKDIQAKDNIIEMTEEIAAIAEACLASVRTIGSSLDELEEFPILPFAELTQKWANSPNNYE
ncbi:hypothetical protein LEN26_010384 [Aphanomyces euteiches]|nr:hypothetical protein AeMF1_009998 [Aphanomyces euteiches]KAH9122049.1 hypothetical protein LEN26_010384 [Aphanomyces euteiches]KAH9196636.1 hypothetical protein AeNC1_001400 [Aphanomyces euteiches]